MEEGHTSYCGLVFGPHVEKLQSVLYLTASVIVYFLWYTRNLKICPRAVCAPRTADWRPMSYPNQTHI